MLRKIKETKTLRPRASRSVIILSVIAVLNAGYLTRLGLRGSTGFCDLSEKFSCSAALASPATQIFGIPFPAVALVVYPLLARLAHIATCDPRGRTRLAVLSGLGILMNGFFLRQEARIGVFCLLCVLCSGIILTIFLLALLATRKN